jgi:hypothetical protein
MTQEQAEEYVRCWKWKIPEHLSDNLDDVVKEFKELVHQHEPETLDDYENLFTRAVVKVSNNNIPTDCLLADYIGERIDSTSVCKKVRKEVEDIYFRLYSELEGSWSGPSQFLLIWSVNEYNRKHGYLGKHKRM